MGNCLYLPDGLVIETHRDLIDATPMSVPDLSWRFVDANGHEHKWHGRYPNISLPTLREVTDVEGFEYYDEDGYESWAPSETHWECVQCGATVPEPALKGNAERYYVAGLVRYRINGELATKEQVEEALKRQGLM